MLLIRSSPVGGSVSQIAAHPVNVTTSIIKKRLKERWQKQWDKEKKGRWFYRIQRKVGEMRSAGKNRRDERVISRMGFGHTRLNSTLYKMGKHDTGRCEFCGQEESVEHVILYCQKYETERRILMQNVEKIKMPFKLNLEIYYKMTREMNAIVLFFSTLK